MKWTEAGFQASDGQEKSAWIAGRQTGYRQGTHQPKLGDAAKVFDRRATPIKGLYSRQTESVLSAAGPQRLRNQ